MGAARARAMTENHITPVIETRNGKLRGLLSGGVSVFKGNTESAKALMRKVVSSYRRFVPGAALSFRVN